QDIAEPSEEARLFWSFLESSTEGSDRCRVSNPQPLDSSAALQGASALFAPRHAKTVGESRTAARRWVANGKTHCLRLHTRFRLSQDRKIDGSLAWQRFRDKVRVLLT